MESPKCVDLDELFPEYQLDWDDAAFSRAYPPGQRPKSPSVKDPWYRVLKCQFATVFPYNETTLAVEVEGHAKTANRLRAMAALEGSPLKIYTDGDDGITIHTDIAGFNQIAEIIKPRKRRVMSDEQKQSYSDRIEPFRFKRGATQSEFGSAGRDETPQDGPE